MANVDLNSMSQDELLALCDQQDIPVAMDNSQVTKQDLIRRLTLGKEAVMAEEQQQHVSSTLRQPGSLTAAEQEAAAAAGPPTVESGVAVDPAWRPPAPAGGDGVFDAAVTDTGQPASPRTSAVPSGTLGTASAALSTLSRSEVEQLGIILDKMRGANGLDTARTPRVSLQLQGQNFPPDHAATAALKIGDVLETLRAAGHQVDPSMIPRRGWAVRRGEGFEDGYHEGPAFLSVVTNDGRNLYARIDGLDEDAYARFEAERETKKYAGMRAVVQELAASARAG